MARGQKIERRSSKNKCKNAPKPEARKKAERKNLLRFRPSYHMRARQIKPPKFRQSCLHQGKPPARQATFCSLRDTTRGKERATVILCLFVRFVWKEKQKCAVCRLPSPQALWSVFCNTIVWHFRGSQVTFRKRLYTWKRLLFALRIFKTRSKIRQY